MNHARFTRKRATVHDEVSFRGNRGGKGTILVAKLQVS